VLWSRARYIGPCLAVCLRTLQKEREGEALRLEGEESFA
jgi:hypothetical protein